MIIPIADCLDNNYFNNLSKKHCQSVFDEINDYQPKENIPLCQEIIEFRRQTKQFQKDKSQEFFMQDFIKENLDEKWSVETYNINCFLRLYDLLLVAEDIYKQAIKIKLNQFKQKILNNRQPYPSLTIDFTKFNIQENNNDEDIDWEN